MNSKSVRHLFSKGMTEVYTTGAYLSPIKVVIEGQEQWLWKVDEFHDDCFMFGEECFPAEASKSKAGLIS